jgi:hypothetical protein
VLAAHSSWENDWARVHAVLQNLRPMTQALALGGFVFFAGHP